MSGPTVYYGINDPEELRHDNVFDCVEDYLDGLEIADWPETLLVESYCRMPFKFNADRILEAAIEQAEEVDNPDGSEITEPMRDAARAFAEVLGREFVPWVCEKNGADVTINVMEWVREHRPNWLEEAKG